MSSEGGYDGGNLKISVNGGPWMLVQASDFIYNAYNGTLLTAAGGNNNPMAGQPAFMGTDAGSLSGSWGRSIAMTALSVLDLAPIVEGGSAAEACATHARLARHAEAWGYQRYWLAEHHNMDGVACSATAVLVATFAGGTKTIRVGSGGVMLPNHAPLVVAEQFGTLATLYPGRIDLGLGRAPGTDRLTDARAAPHLAATKTVSAGRAGTAGLPGRRRSLARPCAPFRAWAPRCRSGCWAAACTARSWRPIWACRCLCLALCARHADAGAGGLPQHLPAQCRWPKPHAMVGVNAVARRHRRRSGVALHLHPAALSGHAARCARAAAAAHRSGRDGSAVDPREKAGVQRMLVGQRGGLAGGGAPAAAGHRRPDRRQRADRRRRHARATAPGCTATSCWPKSAGAYSLAVAHGLAELGRFARRMTGRMSCHASGLSRARGARSGTSASRGCAPTRRHRRQSSSGRCGTPAPGAASAR
jgi:hypothetical protein